MTTSMTDNTEYSKPFVTIEQIEDALEERQLPDRRSDSEEAIAADKAAIERKEKRQKKDRRQS